MQTTSAAASTPGPLGPARVIARIAASLIGGWIFVWGFIAAGIAVLSTAGMAFGDARNFIHLLAFLVYLFVACWAFAAASLWRVALILCGGGAGMTALAWFLTRSSG